MKTVTLSSFRGKTDMETFRNAAEYLRNTPGTTLVVEPGTYVLLDEKAKQLQRDVMAGKLTKNPEPVMFNRNFDYVTGIDLRGAKNITIEGSGAVLMFDGFMENISIQFCEDVTIKNLTIDLLRKAYSKGEIINVAEGFADADFGALPLLSEEMPSLRINVYSKLERRYTAISGADRVEFLSTGKYRFYGLRGGNIGDEIYLTHTFHYRPSILIYEAKNTVISDVTIHSHCGMGIVGHRSENILLERLKIVPFIGDAMSTNTDATHFTSCTGLLRFEGCHFEGQGDDATNVHTYYHTIIEKDNNKCVVTVNAPTGTHAQKLDYFDVGDTIELSCIEDLTPVKTYRVLESKPLFDEWKCELTLDGSLPDELDEYYLADCTRLPRLEFLNCFVSNHLARSVLVKTRNVLIQGCSFESNTGTAIHIGAEGWWHEGITAENVVIRSNRMINCGKQGHGRILDAGGVSINILALSPELPAHKNILIENNMIDCPDCKYGILAQNVDGLTIRGNDIRSAQENIVVNTCINVDVRQNGSH